MQFVNSQIFKFKNVARDLRSNMRFNSSFFGGHMESWSAVDAIAIEQRHRWHFQLRAACNQAFGQGRAFEKTKCGAGVKFDVQEQLLAFSL